MRSAAKDMNVDANRRATLRRRHKAARLDRRIEPQLKESNAARHQHAGYRPNQQSRRVGIGPPDDPTGLIDPARGISLQRDRGNGNSCEREIN